MSQPTKEIHIKKYEASTLQNHTKLDMARIIITVVYEIGNEKLAL